MKTTIELSDELHRRAKAFAAMHGRRLKDVVEEGVRLVLEAPHQEPSRPTFAKLMEGVRGKVDSGVPDLGSNPEHLA
jgi:hypothetical protein